MPVLLAADYQGMVVSRLAAIAAQDPTLGLTAPLLATVVTWWGQFTSRGQIDPGSVTDGPYLQFLYCYRQGIETLLEQAAPSTDFLEVVEQKDDQITKHLQQLWQNTTDEIKAREQWAMSSRGPRVGALAITSPNNPTPAVLPDATSNYTWGNPYQYPYNNRSSRTWWP